MKPTIHRTSRLMIVCLIAVCTAVLGIDRAKATAANSCAGVFTAARASDSAARESIPPVPGFTHIATEKVSGVRGELFAIRYDKPHSMHIDPIFMLGQAEVFAQIPFFNQFGFGYNIVATSDPAWRSQLEPSVLVRLPTVAFLRSTSTELRTRRSLAAPAVQVVAYDHIPRDPETISRHYAKREIIVFEPEKPEADDERREPRNIYFYHDRLVHVPFWLVAGPRIVNAVASRHRLLQALAKIVGPDGNKQSIRQVMHFENEVADRESALFNFAAARSSLQVKIWELNGEPGGLLDAINADPINPVLEVMLGLYLLTRTSRSLLDYKSDDEIILSTYENGFVGHAAVRFNIAAELSSQQKAQVRRLWQQQFQSKPELELSDLEQVRLEILRRVDSRAIRSISFQSQE